MNLLISQPAIFIEPAMKKIPIALCLSLLLLTGCGAAETPLPTFTPKPKELETFRDIAYLGDGLEEHTLDIYLPAIQEGPYPTLLVFHGGNGKKEDFGLWGNIFAKKGYAVISSNYRQWPDYQYPSNLEDAFCALAWILENSADYQLDPDQIFFLGHSAGGTLAASLGIVDGQAVLPDSCPDQLPADFRPAGVITFTVIYDYQIAAQLSGGLQDYTVDLLGGTYEEIPEVWQEASPVSWVDGDDPPFLLIHGGEDQSIPPSQSEEFARILSDAGIPTELMIVPGGTHMQVKGSPESMDAVERFISEVAP